MICSQPEHHWNNFFFAWKKATKTNIQHFQGVFFLFVCFVFFFKQEQILLSEDENSSWTY